MILLILLSGCGAEPEAAPAAPAAAAPVAAVPAVPAAAVPAAAPFDPASIPEAGKVTLSDGVTIDITAEGQVTVTAADGGMVSQSVFGAGGGGFSYRQSVTFMLDLQQRVKAGDPAMVADLMDFPLRVNTGGKPRMVKNREVFIRDYAQILPSSVTARVLSADPRVLFCRMEQVMLGDGVLWAGGDATILRVQSINL